jgi:hypothetical protein
MAAFKSDGRRNAYKIYCSPQCWNKVKNARQDGLRRKSQLAKKYGLTPDDYDVLLAAHGGRCWICLKEPKPGGRRLHVDHDHRTKRVRGILCWKCNTGLANFNDSRGIMRKAADYLESTVAQDLIERERDA